MKYKDFINLVEQHQTPHIKPLALPESCAIGPVPEVFSSFLPDILKIMESYYRKFSTGKPLWGVFGLQAASLPLESEEPNRLNRIMDSKHSQQHLCYTLSYLPTTAKELLSLKDWTGSDSLIIDFTRGYILDKERYFYELFQSGTQGKILGRLNKNKLRLAWESFF